MNDLNLGKKYYEKKVIVKHLIQTLCVDFGQKEYRDRGSEIQLQNESQRSGGNHWKTGKEK